MPFRGGRIGLFAEEWEGTRHELFWATSRGLCDGVEAMRGAETRDVSGVGATTDRRRYEWVNDGNKLTQRADGDDGI